MPVCNNCLIDKEDSLFPKRKKEFCSYCCRRFNEIRYKNSEKGKKVSKEYAKSDSRKKYELNYRTTPQRIEYLEKFRSKMRERYSKDEEFRKNEILRRILHHKKNPNIKKENEKRHSLKNPEKQKARIRLRMAVYRGTILKPKICQICHSEKKRIEAHHEDYTKPFDVIWMCVECHKIRHGKIIGIN